LQKEVKMNKEWFVASENTKFGERQSHCSPWIRIAAALSIRAAGVALELTKSSEQIARCGGPLLNLAVGVSRWLSRLPAGAEQASLRQAGGTG
jgi:hypothetical protein